MPDKYIDRDIKGKRRIVDNERMPDVKMQNKDGFFAPQVWIEYVL